MTIYRLKTFPVSGRWATAHSFLTTRLEDVHPPTLSTRFAKGDALLATSPRTFWEEKEILSVLDVRPARRNRPTQRGG